MRFSPKYAHPMIRVKILALNSQKVSRVCPKYSKCMQNHRKFIVLGYPDIRKTWCQNDAMSKCRKAETLVWPKFGWLFCARQLTGLTNFGPKVCPKVSFWSFWDTQKWKFLRPLGQPLVKTVAPLTKILENSCKITLKSQKACAKFHDIFGHFWDSDCFAQEIHQNF